MNKEMDEIKKKVQKHSEKLSKLGKDLSQIQFNYKVLDETKIEYWQKRVENFKRYHEKGMEYYMEIQSMMSIVEKEKSELFLLNISKLHQLSTKLLGLLEEIKQNPSIMSSKDKQQSKWSKEIKEQLIEVSNDSISLEKEMNTNFREFYNSYLKNLLE